MVVISIIDTYEYIDLNSYMDRRGNKMPTHIHVSLLLKMNADLVIFDFIHFE